MQSIVARACAVALLLLGFGAASAHALDDRASNVVPQSVRVYTNNGYHTYRGLHASVQYGAWPEQLCAKGLTRDGTIRNGPIACAVRSGSSYPYGHNNCLPTGDPVTRAYSYWVGGGGSFDTSIWARTGVCF